MIMLFQSDGQRKYLTDGERRKFIELANCKPIDERLFCNVLAFTGCRISEALLLTRNSVEPELKSVIIKSLKKRNNTHFRSVPIPAQIVSELVAWIDADQSSQPYLWNWSRTKAWMVVKSVMKEAKVEGAHASPKGLRHGFGIAAIEARVPLNMVQKWLGHSRIETTAIYTNASGREERNLAAKMWLNVEKSTVGEPMD